MKQFISGPRGNVMHTVVVEVEKLEEEETLDDFDVGTVTVRRTVLLCTSLSFTSHDGLQATALCE